MPAPVNLLKRRLTSGQTLYGCWLGMADPYAAEIAGTAGFDWLLVDGEHAPNDLRSITAQLQVIAASPAAAVVRLPDHDPTKIKQALDVGAQTLLVPMVETGDQAGAILRATRYPPEGIRGVGSALARASRFAAIPDYLTTASAEICLLLQVESQAGLAALDDILAIDGIDGVFLGPSDLAADMGLPGQPAHREVKVAVLDALRRIRAAGRTAGVLTTDPGYIEACREAGATFIGVGIDVVLYAMALRQLAARFVSEPQARSSTT